LNNKYLSTDNLSIDDNEVTICQTVFSLILVLRVYFDDAISCTQKHVYLLLSCILL